MFSPSFRIIKLVVVWMQWFEICDFVCKKVGITWEWESRSELRYSVQQARLQACISRTSVKP
jgi:hypothetical protein